VNDSLEPTAVFTIAKLHDFKWGTNMCKAAASANKLELLQWLHKSGCPWNLQHMCNAVVHLDDLSILKWLYAVTKPWTQTILDELLWDAGINDNLELAQWLHEIGAAWPHSFHSLNELYDTGFWNLSLVKWAVANGCSRGVWQCQDMLPQRWPCGICEHQHTVCYRENCDSNLACVLLEWAHENGCPCTCDAETAVAVKTAIAQQQQASGN
jgi:hypothetical protein